MIRNVIYDNLIASMSVLTTNAGLLGGDCLVHHKEALARFQAFAIETEFMKYPMPCWDLIYVLWNDPGIQATWARRAEFQITESVKRYLDDLERISKYDYLPDDHDIVHSRIRTTGVVATKFNIKSELYEIYDAGGQRSERRKWANYFDGMSCIVFVAAVNEYNQKLAEDDEVNRMVEALNLFEEMAENPVFKKTTFILFLNKKDLFREKIKVKPISDTPEFADYTGGSDYQKACEYFKGQFKTRWERANKKLQVKDREHFPFFTHATDAGDVKHVFDLCRRTITMKSLYENNLM